MALDDSRRPDEDRRKRWRRILGRILALVPEETLYLEAKRDLRRQMEKDGELKDNRPVCRRFSSSVHQEDWEMERLRRDGVDMDAGPNGATFDASNALYAKVTKAPDGSDVAGLSDLWSDVIEQVPRTERGRGMRISWRNVVGVGMRCESMVALAPRFAEERSGVVDQNEEILKDDVPALRLQAAQDLQVICKAAPDRMWSMGERIAASETDDQVLTAYLGQPLRRF